MKKNSILLIITSLLAIYAIIGFVAIPKILKPQVEKALNENLTQKSSLQKVEFNPFLLKLTLHKLKIFNEKETTVSVDKVYVDFSILKSIDELHISFRDLHLVNPYINIIENEDGTLNLQKLVKEQKEKKEEEKEISSSNIKFQIYKTILDNAKINFTKLVPNEEPFKLAVDKLNYTFYDMGTYRNNLASHTLRILINKNSELIIKGGLRLDPFKMYGNVELKNFKPKEFLTYKKEMLNFDLNEDSYLNLKFGYKVDASDKLKLELDHTYLDLNNFDLKQKDNSILSIKNFAIDDLNLKYPENLVTIESILLNKLDTKAIVQKDGLLNFANLIKEEKEEVEQEQETDTKEEQTGDQAPWKVVLKKLNIKESNVKFDDLKNSIFVDTKNINVDLNSFNLNGEKISLSNLAVSKPTVSFKDTKNNISLSTGNIDLNLKAFNQDSQNITLENISLNTPKLLFNDNKNKMSVNTKGIKLDANSLNKSTEQISLNDAKLSIPSVSFNDKKNRTTVQTNSINVDLNSLTSKEENVDLKTLKLTVPKLTFKDNKNKLHIFTKTTTATVSNVKKVKENIAIGNVNVKNPSIFLRDYKNSLKIVTNSLGLEAQTLNINGSNVKLKKAKLKTPSVKFNDLKNKMDITTKNINVIATSTSLVKEKLKVSYLSLTKPTVYLTDNKNDKTIVAKNISLKVNGISNYKDSLYVSKVNLYEPNVTIKDKKAKTDIIAKNIYVNVQKISNKKNKLKIVSSSINKPYVSITLGKQDPKPKDENTTDKKVEEKKVVVTKKAKKKSDFQFDIGPVKIKDMKMTFEDKNLPIPFKTNISDLNGNFSRLHSSSSKPTKLLLEGKVDEYGYTKITGTVDINDIKLLTDTNLLFKNIAVKNFTPYSGKFVGREIESGKLNLDLKYNIKKSDLKAENSVIVDKIKFGKNVESPDAVNLPLELAIALLEDSNGVIDLNLPVSGNVDDPQFSIAPIVWKAFFNLIMKAITSPFALLGAIIGVDEDQMKSLEFEFGKSDIIPSEKETLDNIAKILTKKPKLAIKIKPSYDPIKDKLALQDIKFEKFLIKEMDKIPEGDEYKEALEDIYGDLDGVKKLDEIEKSFTKKDKKGKKEFDNDAYVEYLRKTLASKQKVSEKELVDLAKGRVAKLTKYLLVDKKIPKKSIIMEKVEKQNNEKAKWAIFDLDVATQ